MKYYKLLDSKIIQRFNKDWSAWDWYYIEIDNENNFSKEIHITYDGKVFKHNDAHIETKIGDIAETVMDNAGYEPITKDEFYELWNKKFTNTYLVKQLQFDTNWKMAWYNIDYNKTEQELYDGNLILCGTYKDTFLLEIEFSEHSNYLFYSVSEGNANIKYSTVDNWDELVSSVQLIISYIEKNAENVYVKPEAEKVERTIKVLVDDVLKDATFEMYRNMDWGVEKFRGAYLNIEDEKYAHINTYIGVEDLMIDLQNELPENIKIQSCFFCRFSNYMVAGNDNFGDLNCFMQCKEKCNGLKTKNDIIDLFTTDFDKSKKVEETFYCEEFEAIEVNNFVFKNVIK